MADEPKVQISRNGHAFWVSDVRELEEGIFVAKVANHGVPFFPFGSVIAFVDFKGHTEVKDIVIDNLQSRVPANLKAN